MTVVLAHVPNPAAEAAFAAALEQAVFRGSDIVLVNATKGDALVDPHFASAEALDALQERASTAGVRLSVERPVDPDIPGAVLAAAGRHRASVIVIGIRHRSAVGKFLLGSDAQRILLDADCQVLAVKA